MTIALPTVSTVGTSATHTERAPGENGVSFLSTVHNALNDVSSAQSSASIAQDNVTAGKPGASEATAMLLSDRAELAWSGVVAVRNEVVAAYQTLTNMQI